MESIGCVKNPMEANWVLWIRLKALRVAWNAKDLYGTQNIVKEFLLLWIESKWFLCNHKNVIGIHRFLLNRDDADWIHKTLMGSQRLSSTPINVIESYWFCLLNPNDCIGIPSICIKSYFFIYAILLIFTDLN